MTGEPAIEKKIYTEEQAKRVPLDALRGQGGQLTKADAVALSGLPAADAEQALTNLLKEYRSHLAATESGELVYEFDPAFERRDAVPLAERLAKDVFKDIRKTVQEDRASRSVAIRLTWQSAPPRSALVRVPLGLPDCRLVLPGIGTRFRGGRRGLRVEVGKLRATTFAVHAGPAMSGRGKPDGVHAVEAFFALACLQFAVLRVA